MNKRKYKIFFLLRVKGENHGHSVCIKKKIVFKIQIVYHCFFKKKINTLGVGIIKFQTWDKLLRCPFSISKQTCPQGSSCISPSLFQGMAGIPCPLTFQPRELCYSLLYKTILVACSLSNFWPSGCCTWSSLSPFPPHLPIWPGSETSPL